MPIPFRDVASEADEGDLVALIDNAGISDSTFLSSDCVQIDVTGWDPGSRDADMFVGYEAGSGGCEGDSMSRFFAVRSGVVTTSAVGCGDCVVEEDPFRADYLAVVDAFRGSSAVRLTVVGGAHGWGFEDVSLVQL